MAKVETLKPGEQQSMFAPDTESKKGNRSRKSAAPARTASPERVIDLKSSSVLAVTAVLHTTDMKLLDAYLKDAAGPEGDFFTNDITVIDLRELTGKVSAIDWAAMIEMFKSYRLSPVVVRNAPSEMESAILASGLGIDAVGLARSATLPEAPVIPETTSAAVAPPRNEAAMPKTEPSMPPVQRQPVQKQTTGTMIIDTPVRSGSRIYAPNADVIVTAVVNPGAEIIADGSIHIYAPLKGRALAGAKGNAAARIFALSMEAELVSIAGVYSTFEDGPDPKLKKRPCQIRLVGNRLEIKPFDSSF
ncbi:MAG: septum site-determining protein MinC [Burkholderiaceae bacterium]|nr:septum site-determining protein MinC [Burkholderiaceae bacterium]